MSKVLRIIRHEIGNAFRRPMFLIVTFGIPILGVLIVLGIQFFRAGGDAVDAPAQGGLSNMDLEVEGYIDQSGLIQMIPTDLPAATLIEFDNEAAANAALDNGEITAYYIIPPDYLERGDIYYVFPETRSLLDDGQSWVMKWTLMVNLQEGDMAAADRVWNTIWRMDMTDISVSEAEGAALNTEDACSRPNSNCQSNELVRMMPTIMVALFYITFMTSSSMLFNSIGGEKENRTMEVMMVSIHPRQMLAGKTIANGLCGLMQTVVWLGAVYLIFTMGGQTLRLPENFAFPIDILIWGLVFFIGGFAVYASLMAGSGVLVPRIKEAGAANFVAMSPLLLAYMIGLMAPMAESTRALLPMILSFFPLTSPILMMMRLTDGIVPLWELLISVVLLFISAVFIQRAVARMFRAQYLLSGEPFSFRRYFRAMMGW